MNEKHPLPWHIDADGPETFAIEDSGHRSFIYGLSEEDAEAIVPAVNEYVHWKKQIDKLIESNEEILNVLALALLDHQRVDPHHSDLCVLCKKMMAAIER